jgi:hypothetical protein
MVFYLKSYDMGPTALLPIREQGVLRVVIARKITVFTRVLPPPVYYPHPNFEGLFQKKNFKRLQKS